MEEDNFEKKSSKKTLKITLVVLLLIVAGIVAIFAYTNITNKPDKVFGKAVSKMFEKTEKGQEVKTTRVELDLSLEAKKLGDNLNQELASQLQMVNLVLKTMSVNAILEMDIENEVFNEKITAKYLGENLISLDGLIQDGKMYFYLNDLYSKYVEIPKEYLEDVELGSLFQRAKVNKELIQDIKEIFVTKIENSEYKTEDVKITLNGKETKVKKSTLTLAQPEVIAMISDILTKVNQYESDEETKEVVSELIEILEDNEAKTDNVLVIDIYTEGLGNKIVRYDFAFVSEEDDEVIVFKMVQKDNKVWEMTSALNEESTSVKEAEELFKIEITEEDEEQGKIAISVKLNEEGIELILNIGYKIENNVEIEKRNISSSITIDEFSEEDLQEVYTNAQKNEILKTVIDMVMNNVNEGAY